MAQGNKNFFATHNFNINFLNRASIDYQHSLLEVILPPESNDDNEASGGGTSRQSLHVPTTTNLILIDTEPSPIMPGGHHTANKCHKCCQTNLIPDSPPPLYKEYWVPVNW